MRVSRPRRYINAYFKELIDGIFQHAGDVIKFAGDAMQVVWRNRRNTFESLPQLVLRASVCCLDLLKRLNNFSPVDGVTLRLHMGIGCGDISEFYVGGHGNKWEYFVAGEPIQQMSDATEAATHGQLVLSSKAWEVINTEEITSMKRLVGNVLESTQFLLTDVQDMREVPSVKHTWSGEAEAGGGGGLFRSLGITRQHTQQVPSDINGSETSLKLSSTLSSKPGRHETNNDVTAASPSRMKRSFLGAVALGAVWATRPAAALTIAEDDEKDETSRRLDITSLLAQVRRWPRLVDETAWWLSMCCQLPGWPPALLWMMFYLVGLISSAETCLHGLKWRTDFSLRVRNKLPLPPSARLPPLRIRQSRPTRPSSHFPGPPPPLPPVHSPGDALSGARPHLALLRTGDHRGARAGRPDGFVGLRAPQARLGVHEDQRPWPEAVRGV